MIKVRELFRDTNSTEFVIVTIPTVFLYKHLEEMVPILFQKLINLALLLR